MVVPPTPGLRPQRPEALRNRLSGIWTVCSVAVHDLMDARVAEAGNLGDQSLGMPFAFDGVANQLVAAFEHLSQATLGVAELSELR